MGIRFSSGAVARTCLAFWVVLAFATAAFARERGPRVEVVCPTPPIPVRIGQQQVLVYELNVTNFDVVPLTLKRLEVFANEESAGPVSSLADDKLSAAMIRVGAPMVMSGMSGGKAEDNRGIAPGTRSVIFMWIELPLNRSLPDTLKHRMSFSAAAQDGATTDVILEDFQVPVSHVAVL